jgi:signal transduction histidine kinase
MGTAPRNRHHVLIIDDDEVMARYAAAQLERRQYRTSIASGATEGLAMVAREQPDLIVLDHYLPDGTGADVLARLRDGDATRFIPVIYLTIDASHRRFRGSMTGGADDFLAKPFKPQDLIDAVDTQLRKHYARMLPAPPASVSNDDAVDHLAAQLRSMVQRMAGATQPVAPGRRPDDGSALALTDRLRALQAANDTLRTYGAAVAHELRGPLRGILGFSGLLLENHGPALGDEARLMLQGIERSGRRMVDFMDCLLALGSPAEQALKRSEVDLSALADDVLRAMPSELLPAGARVVIAPRLTASIDPVLLRVVIDNLLSNALKFSAPNPAPLVELGGIEAGVGTAYFVRDNGIGFDMAQADRLFHQFQRLHDPARFEGFGIGLATVRQIVERHGGRVWADGRPGEGATFYFTLI